MSSVPRVAVWPVARRQAIPRASAEVVSDRQAPSRILIRAGSRIVVVRVDEIDWVEGSGDYVSVHVGKKAWLLRETIAALVDRYAARGLVRIHRSTLVNLDRIEELRPLTNGEFTVMLRDGTALKMSRNYRSALHALEGRGN